MFDKLFSHPKLISLLYDAQLMKCSNTMQKIYIQVLHSLHVHCAQESALNVCAQCTYINEYIYTLNINARLSY